jgi:hypothetical protein
LRGEAEAISSIVFIFFTKLQFPDHRPSPPLAGLFIFLFSAELVEVSAFTIDYRTSGANEIIFI